MRKSPSLPAPDPAVVVDTDLALQKAIVRLAAELDAAPLLAVDTESNSMYAYREHICLIQLSTRQTDYIVDPLTVIDIYPLAALFEDTRIEKVFHAAENDILGLKRDYGFEFYNIFDTLIAARICGRKSFGLNSLLNEHFEVQLDKRHQRDNWGKRPLPPQSLRYAQMDTHYLPLLRDLLFADLEQTGRLAEAREAFSDLERLPPGERREFDPEGYWRLGAPYQLNRRQMAVLREMFLLREEIAAQRDVPPFKVLNNPVLVTLAQELPRSKRALNRLSGISPNDVRRYGERIMQAIERGLNATPPKRPRQQRPDAAVMGRYEALSHWRKTRAEERGVESDVIVPRATLWALAKQPPGTLDDLREVDGLGPWRLEAYGSEILDILSSSQDS